MKGTSNKQQNTSWYHCSYWFIWFHFNV